MTEANMSGAIDALLNEPLPALMARAAALRDDAHGDLHSY